VNDKNTLESGLCDYNTNSLLKNPQTTDQAWIIFWRRDAVKHTGNKFLLVAAEKGFLFFKPKQTHYLALWNHSLAEE
jgi:hypothetical protein